MFVTRKTDRSRCFLRGRIVFNNKQSTIDCNIRNISEAGARLEISEALTVPGEFDLVIPQKGQTSRARVRWRTRDAMGIEFVQEAAPAPRGPDWALRVRELELENAELRLQLADLTAKLDRLEQRKVIPFRAA